jgi:hypothetical protein
MANQYEQKSQLVAPEVQRVLTFKRWTLASLMQSKRCHMHANADVSFLAILDDANRSFARSGDSMQGWSKSLGCFDRAAGPARHLRDGNRTRGFSRQKSVLALVLAHDKISLKDAFDVKALRQIFDSAPGTTAPFADVRGRPETR